MTSVSVILPCFNSQVFVSTSIKSVLAQTHQPLELIIIDDGSTDLSPAIIQELSLIDNRIRFVRLANNTGGPARPRNIGLSMACGDYIAFIDADDIWQPHKLELQLEVMKYNRLNFTSTNCESITENRNILPTTSMRETKISTLTHRSLLMKNRVVTSGVVVTKDVAGIISFDERPEYIAIEDYLAWLKLLQHNDTRAGILGNKLVFYRQRTGSLSHSKRIMAQKVYRLLSNYKVNGEYLGIRKYMYFSSYAINSILIVLKRLLEKK